MTLHAAPIARDHCLAPGRVDAPIFGGRYRSLFEDLPALRVEEEALHGLGRPGGPCDLAAFPDEDTDACVAAVWPFFGQFVAHDLTADRSPLVGRAEPESIRNFRAPRANLESLYGAGPAGAPYLYNAGDRARLLLAPTGDDVPRNHEGTALIGDPRNDVHLFMNQMVVAFSRLHNTLVDRLREDGVGEGDVFEEARRATTWHLQHVILREFLPGLIGADLTAELLADGPRHFRTDGEPYIPFEFADAAYRYGHAQIRSRYQVNERLGPCSVFPDLMGFGRPAGACGRLDAAHRPRGSRAGPARQTHRRAAASCAHRAAHAGLGVGAGHRLRVAGHPGPAARARGRPALGGGDRAQPRGAGAEQGRGGSGRVGVGRRDAAVALRPQGGRGPARRRPAGPGRRQDRR